MRASTHLVISAVLTHIVLMYFCQDGASESGKERGKIIGCITGDQYVAERYD